MSRYRTVVNHLGQLQELDAIIASMKTLSQIELHKLSGVSQSQHALMAQMQALANDFYHHFPQPEDEADELLLVIGSERGFCGDFNETLKNTLLEQYPQSRETPRRVLAVGHKLWLRLEGELPGFLPLEGAGVSEELPHTLGAVIAGVQQRMLSEGAGALRVLYHDDQLGRIESRRLLPPELSQQKPWSTPPLLQLQPLEFLEQFLQHYLYLALNELFVVSLLAESQFRVQHLEGAVQRLDETLDELSMRARSLRQEEITEEIETILLGTGLVAPLD